MNNYMQEIIEKLIKTEDILVANVPDFCYDGIQGHFCFTGDKDYIIWSESDGNHEHRYIFDDNQKLYNIFYRDDKDFKVIKK